MSPSPLRCGLGPWRYSLSRPQRVHLCYGPVTRSLPWGDLVDRLQSFSFHHLCYPNYGALTSTPAGLSPAEHASLRWTHVGSRAGASLWPGGPDPHHVSSPLHVGRVEGWRAGRPFDRATFPVPSTSHAAGGFPALRAPICFTPTLMGPILLGRLSARRVALDRR
jgi:hypothetical protein